MSDYHEQRQMNNEERLDEMLKNELPLFAGKFFAHLRTRNLSSLTMLQYAYDLKLFFDYLAAQPGFKDVDFRICRASVLDRLTVDDLQEYQNSIRFRTVQTAGKEKRKPQSEATRARRASSLRSFYRYMVRIREIEKDMSEFIDVPSVRERPIIILDKTDVQLILAAVSDTSGMTEAQIKRHSHVTKRDYAILVTLLGTGIRVSELVGLDVGDIDFYQASFNVVRKGGDIDEVFFGPEVEDALHDYIDHERDLLSPSPDDSDALFVSMKHTRVSVRNVEILVKNYARKAGIADKITPHKMRSTYGSNLYEETEDIYLVADRKSVV